MSNYESVTLTLAGSVVLGLAGVVEFPVKDEKETLLSMAIRYFWTASQYWFIIFVTVSI